MDKSELLFFRFVPATGLKTKWNLNAATSISETLIINLEIPFLVTTVLFVLLFSFLFTIGDKSIR